MILIGDRIFPRTHSFRIDNIIWCYGKPSHPTIFPCPKRTQMVLVCTRIIWRALVGAVQYPERYCTIPVLLSIIIDFVRMLDLPERPRQALIFRVPDRHSPKRESIYNARIKMTKQHLSSDVIFWLDTNTRTQAFLNPHLFKRYRWILESPLRDLPTSLNDWLCNAPLVQVI